VDEKPTPGLFDLLTMGVGMGVAVAIGLVAGLLADALLHTGPGLTFLGLALGVAGGVAFVVTRARKFL
jgi:hypothetical protein